MNILQRSSGTFIGQIQKQMAAPRTFVPRSRGFHNIHNKSKGSSSNYASYALAGSFLAGGALYFYSDHVKHPL